jgi:hypothetical protein
LDKNRSQKNDVFSPRKEGENIDDIQKVELKEKILTGITHTKWCGEFACLEVIK